MNLNELKFEYITSVACRVKFYNAHSSISAAFIHDRSDCDCCDHGQGT